jgi:antitoxin ParD1/3/4
MARTSRPITVTLGELKVFVDERVNAGRYASASEVVRAGLRALERQEAAVDDWMRAKIKESLDDPHPDIPAEKVFAELRARNAALIATDAKRK